MLSLNSNPSTYQSNINVQGITDMFRAEDTDLDGVVTISYEKFLTMLLNSSLL